MKYNKTVNKLINIFFIVLTFIFFFINKNINALIKANNFILDTKIDHDYVLGYIDYVPYDHPLGFAKKDTF